MLLRFFLPTLLVSSLLTSTAHAAPGWTAVLPFGGNLYVRDHPGRGVAYSVTQAGGITGILLAERAAAIAREREDTAADLRFQFMVGGGAALSGLSFFVSILDASRIDEIEAARGAGRAWTPPTAVYGRAATQPATHTVTSRSPSLVAPGSTPTPLTDVALDKLWITPPPLVDKLGTPYVGLSELGDHNP